MKNMVNQAETLADMNLKLDVIITSPLTRAYQTADIVAERLKMSDRLIQDERLAPGFGVDDLASVLQDHVGAENLMLVGHEPDFSLTVSALIGGSRLLFKKGGLARVDLGSLNPPQGELVWLLPPAVLIH
jgi:phosphohistidine phosphatase